MKRGRTLGMTQLELLISLAVMAMMAVLLANAFNFNRQSLDRSSFLSDHTQVLLNQNQLKRFIELIPLDYDGNEAAEYFTGTPNGLTLISRRTANELDRVMISTGKSTDDQNTQILQLKNADGSQNTRVLANEVKSITIRYYGRLSTEPDNKWHDAWADPVFLPTLVKIEWLTTDGRVIPPMTAIPGAYERHRQVSVSKLVPAR